MIRLTVVVEGQTEEAFVKEVLAPHLLQREIYVSATIVGKVAAQRRGRGGRGGGHFKRWRRDLERLLSGDRSAEHRVTTMFDLYGLPDDFPGIEQHGSDTDTVRRCETLERSLAETLGDFRLVPYLQRHEFEALVLASLPSLCLFLDAEDDLAGLTQLEANIDGIDPEDINDGKTTAPSKRLREHVPGYVKTLHGPMAVMDTGLAPLRARCPRFDAWISRLEALADE